MKKILLYLVLICLPSISNAATPSISNVVGTVSTGQTLTITGSNLVQDDLPSWMNRGGTASTGPNFQSSVQYGFEGASPQADGYCSSGVCGSNTYDTSVKLMGNKSLNFHIAGAYGYLTEAVRFGKADSFIFNSSNYYGRYYVRYDVYNNIWPTFELKLSGTQSPTGILYVNVQPNSNGSAPNSFRIVDPLGQASNGTVPGGALVSGRWYCVEWRIQTGSPNTATVWVNGQQIATKTWSGSFSPVFYEFGPINGGATPAEFVMDNRFDGMAFKTSGRVYPASTIEISGDNGLTWKWQHPASLSDTALQVIADLPTKTAANYLLRVTNNLQQTSSTYTLGGSVGSGDTTAPIVTGFAVPSTSTTLTVPINIFTVADETALAASPYCVTTTNSPSGCSWQSSAPSTVTFSASGSQSIYAWAKDAAGNISTAAATGSVTINNPINGACGSASGQSFASLTSGSSNLCSTGTVASFAGSGPWTWGCNGSGGGSSTSSTACLASLTSIPSAAVLFSESFENNSYSSRGWYDNTNHGTIVSGGQSGNCLQWAWSQGATTPTNGASMRMKVTPTDSLYNTYHVKFQTGWRGSQQTYHPHMMYMLSDLDDKANAYSALANNYLDTYIEFLSDVGSPYTIRPQIALQDNLRVNSSLGTLPNNLTPTTENRSVTYCNTPVSSGAAGQCFNSGTWYTANTWTATNASVSTNAWHHVEVYFKMNTISGGKGQSNGIMQVSLDGVKVIDHNDVLYRTNQDPTKKWAQFVLAPYIGDGAPIAESMWIDELTVATAPPSGSVITPPTVTIKSYSPN